MQLFNTISSHPFFHKHGPKVALIIAIFCLISLLVSSGFSLRNQKRIKAENYAPQPITSISKNKRLNYRINDVVGANLFGNPEKSKPVVRKAPKTTLNLTLHGILSTSDSNIARAIISSNKRKKEQLYSVNEKIDGANASIQEIREQEVIINRNGSIESLPLKKVVSEGNNIIFTNTKNKQNLSKQNKANSVQTTLETSNTNARKIRTPKFSSPDRRRVNST